MKNLGLALSGGGSRAAAFHSGTLTALSDLGLLDRIDVISSVSGGSLFGAAWMASRIEGQANAVFVERMQQELTRGFITRSIRPSLLLALCPGVGYSRTHLLADTFDQVFFRNLTLGTLPDHPALCINTTLLNNGQVGKFDRNGFSAWHVAGGGEGPSHIVPWRDFPLAQAVAASAAFPVGLPPLTLPLKDFPEGTTFSGPLEGARAIYLTDGGVLENLGIQTLLKSHRYATWDLIVSDAGVNIPPWYGSGFLGSLRGLLVWLLCGRTLDRLMLVMNDKQNRWARKEAYDQLVLSWLADAVQRGDVGEQEARAIEKCLGYERRARRRMLLFARIAQDWNSFFRSIPAWRLFELANNASISPITIPSDTSVNAIIEHLERMGCDLEVAKEWYGRAGSESGVRRIKEVETNFTALPRDTVTRLAAHAAWQVHAAHAVYTH